MWKQGRNGWERMEYEVGAGAVGGGGKMEIVGGI